MKDLKPQVWFPFYFKDFLVDTSRLTPAQRWDYIMLLGHQWYCGHFRKEDIPTIVGISSDIVEASSATTQLEFSQAVAARLEKVVELLSVDSNGLYFSPRLDLELSKAIENRRSHAERGRKGGLEKERRRQEKLASSASSELLAQGVAGGLAKSYPAPAPEEKQKQLPPSRPSLTPPPVADRAAGERPPAPPSGSKPAAAPGATDGEIKEKPPDLPRRAAAEGREDVRGHDKAGASAYPAKKNIAPGSRNGAHPHFGDPRGDAFQREIFKYWAAQNPERPGCPWVGSDARALVAYLAGSPKASLEHFKHLLKNRAGSEVNPSAPPRKWIRDLEEFAGGPLDRFKKPLRSSRRL